MRLAARMRSFCSRRRRAAVAGAACLLLAATAACGPAEGPATPAGTVEKAVAKMTAEEAASVIAELDAPPGEVRELLREFGRDAGWRDARRLARAEVAIALEADRALNELETYGPGTRLALALCLGDRDVLAYKSVGDRVFLRLQLPELAQRGSLTGKQRERIDELVGLADELPEPLKPVEKLLQGGWVVVDPEDFEDYGWAVEEFTDLSMDGSQYRAGTSLLDGGELRAALSGLEDVLVEHATYRNAEGRKAEGRDGEVQRLRVELPARRTAEALAPLLRPMGADFDPREVPRRSIPAELTVRRGSLAELRLDLGSLTDGGTARVPLRLEFSPGDVFSAKPPKHYHALEPQDLLAAALYAVTQRST